MTKNNKSNQMDNCYECDLLLHVLINSKYHNDTSPTPPCSKFFSQGYCFFLLQEWGGGEGRIIWYLSTLKDFILEHYKATSIFQILNIFFQDCRLEAGGWVANSTGQRGFLVYSGTGTGFGFTVSAHGQWGTHPQLATYYWYLILKILIILLLSISMNVNRSRSCLGKNLILKRLDCLKHFDWINLPSNDYAQVFWSIELLMIAANLLNQTTK